MKQVHIIGVPLDLGGGRRGVDMGPSAVRIAGLGERLAALGFRVVDKGDLPTPIPETRARRRPAQEIHPRDRAGLPEALRGRRRVARDGALPLVLGGDHSLAAGSVAAAADARAGAGLPIGLIWVDAHGDMNTPATHAQRQRPRHAARGAARPGARGAVAHRRRSRRRSARRSTVLIGVRNLDDREKRDRPRSRASTSSR